MAFSASVFANPDPVKPFVVVLDAGHGGKDPGNLGKRVYGKNHRPKNSLRGRCYYCPLNQDIKVIYTRDSVIILWR